MAKKNISLAIGLTVAFLAMQTPHLAQAIGGGGVKQEVINTTFFPPRDRERQILRTAVPVQTQSIKADNAKGLDSRGIWGRLFSKS